MLRRESLAEATPGILVRIVLSIGRLKVKIEKARVLSSSGSFVVVFAFFARNVKEGGRWVPCSLRLGSGRN